MKKNLTMEEVLEMGFATEVEVEEERENMAWIFVTPSFVLVCR